ncbi:hypothetical protein TNCV_4192931 [Trichonephila clavipes]|nr:hypothetical protein TNCV_4192931 [Trichonephila clavipes]
MCFRRQTPIFDIKHRFSDGESPEEPSNAWLISQLKLRTLSSLHESNTDFDNVVTWRTIGPITPNFFSILEQYLQLSGHGLPERASAFPLADPFCGEFLRLTPVVSVST